MRDIFIHAEADSATNAWTLLSRSLECLMVLWFTAVRSRCAKQEQIELSLIAWLFGHEPALILDDDELQRPCR